MSMARLTRADRYAEEITSGRAALDKYVAGDVPRSTGGREGIGGWWYAVALLIPAFGFIASIYWFAKSEIGPGIALWATASIGAALGVMLVLATWDPSL